MKEALTRKLDGKHRIAVVRSDNGEYTVYGLEYLLGDFKKTRMHEQNKTIDMAIFFATATDSCLLSSMDNENRLQKRRKKKVKACF